MMEFVEGVKAKETLGIAQILEGSYEGKKIRMNGAVHNVRDMGEVAFVILRKSRRTGTVRIRRRRHKF